MYIEKAISRISKFIHTGVMNMNILAVVTPPYIYHGWSTRKTFWVRKFTPVNMKNYGCCNFRKHREIKNGEQYIALVISPKFGNMDKIKITYSEPKDYLGIPVKGLITSLGIKTIIRPKKIERTRFSITEAILKDFLRLFMNLKIWLMRVMWGRLTKIPTDSYFYLSRQISKCMTSNSCDRVRTQKMSTQRMSNYKKST